MTDTTTLAEALGAHLWFLNIIPPIAGWCSCGAPGISTQEEYVGHLAALIEDRIRLTESLRARIRLTENVLSEIEYEHALIENSKYCNEGACRECQVTKRVNHALMGIKI